MGNLDYNDDARQAATLTDNMPYEIGRRPTDQAVLPDGLTMEVPRSVMVMTTAA